VNCWRSWMMSQLKFNFMFYQKIRECDDSGKFKAKYKVGDVVLGRRVFGVYVGYNIHLNEAVIIAWRYEGEGESVPLLFTDQATLVRRDYKN